MQKTLGIIAIGFCLSLCYLAPAATWYVDASVPSSGDGTTWETAFKTIQHGIDAASHGDTVIVAQGTYVENIHFHGKNITLTSTDPLDPNVVANTIIDGNQAGSVVTFSGAEGETCVLSGFTVQNGAGKDVEWFGYPFLWLQCGGGIFGGSPDGAHTYATIQNNIISSNWAGVGAGISGCDGIIQNNTVSGNYTYYTGGGLAFCGGLVQNNKITQNSGPIMGGGLCGCHGKIRGNVITGNSADRGGGVFACQAIIENNTIVGNNARGGEFMGYPVPAAGGGLGGCQGIIRNCVIWGNTGLDGPQLYDSSEPTFSCIQDWTRGGQGNIADHPRFVDPDGPDDDPNTHDDNDYRLLPDSPCIDAGKNEDWTWNAFDLDGNSRIFRGTSSLTVDMGAYEYPSVRPPEVRFTIVSAHGAPDPPAGTYTYFSGDTVSEGGVDSPADVDDGIRYRCTGYTGTRSAPSGSWTAFPSFTITENSTLTWNWMPQYRVTALPAERGVVRPKGKKWHDEGKDATFTAYPDDGYTVDTWFVDGDEVQVGGSTFTLSDIRAPHEVTAEFLKIHSIAVRSNIQAQYELKELPDGEPIRSTTSPTADPKVFEKVHEEMEPGDWEITWVPQPDAWPREPVTETKTLEEDSVIVFTKDYIVNMPSDLYQLVIEPVDYAMGTFTARVRIRNTTGEDGGAARTFTAPMWLVVKDIVFTVTGPDSEGRLWNADGLTSTDYPDSGDYYYVDVSDWASLGPGETSPEMVLEFYIKDRNPSFEPVIEVWADDPVAADGSRFCIENVALVADGAILLHWESSERGPYVVEASDSPMGPWAPISDEIRSGSDTIEWLDWPPEYVSRRFYRIRATFR